MNYEKQYYFIASSSVSKSKALWEMGWDWNVIWVALIVFAIEIKAEYVNCSELNAGLVEESG